MIMTFDDEELDQFDDVKNFSDPFLDNFNLTEKDYDNENWDVDSILKTVNY